MTKYWRKCMFWRASRLVFSPTISQSGLCNVTNVSHVPKAAHNTLFNPKILLLKYGAIEIYNEEEAPTHLWKIGAREGIAPTHSRSRHYMRVSGQRDAPAALYPRAKDPPPPVPIVQEAGWASEPVLTQKLEKKKSTASARYRTWIALPIQSAARHWNIQ
jgi:hypothetical protein